MILTSCESLLIDEKATRRKRNRCHCRHSLACSIDGGFEFYCNREVVNHIVNCDHIYAIRAMIVQLAFGCMTREGYHLSSNTNTSPK